MLRDRQSRQPVEDDPARNIRSLLEAKAKIIAQQLQNGLKGRCAAVSKYPRLKDADSSPPAILGEFVAEATFANASLSYDAYDMPFASDGIFELLKKRGSFVASACQGAQTYSAAKNSA